MVEVSVTPLTHDTGEPSGFMITAYDISERKRREEYISHLAHHDVLTGLPTRQLLMDRLEMMLSRSQRFTSKSALLMIDLNNFKHVNDTLGHHVGDRLLVQVAERLRGAVRSMDQPSRGWVATNSWCSSPISNQRRRPSRWHESCWLPFRRLLPSKSRAKSS